MGRERGQVALFVTERAVFRVGAGGARVDRDRAGARCRARRDRAHGFPARGRRATSGDGSRGSSSPARWDLPRTFTPSRAVIVRRASRNGTNRARARPMTTRSGSPAPRACTRSSATRLRRCARRRSSPSASRRRASMRCWCRCTFPRTVSTTSIPALLAAAQSRRGAGHGAVQGAHAAFRRAARRDGEDASARSTRCAAKRTDHGPATCSMASGFVRGAERKGAARSRPPRARCSVPAVQAARSPARWRMRASVDRRHRSSICRQGGRRWSRSCDAAFPACATLAARRHAGDVDMVVNASTGRHARRGRTAGRHRRARSPETLVGDVVITADAHALIRHAMRYGCAWVDGRDMHARPDRCAHGVLRSARAASTDCSHAIDSLTRHGPRTR